MKRITHSDLKGKHCWSAPDREYKQKPVRLRNFTDKYSQVALDFLLNIPCWDRAKCPKNPRGSDKPHIAVFNSTSDSDWEVAYKINLAEYPPYLKDSPIKDALNTEFREQFPFLDSSLTLSQLVNVREDLIEKLCSENSLDTYTLAIAFSYFDRLINCG